MKPCRHYAFQHKSFQEIFAAYYLCWELLNHELTPGSLVSDARFFKELKQVLLFSCGILAVQCEETAVDLIANITTQVNNFGHKTVPIALDCIAECKREKSSTHVKLARVFGSGLQLLNARLETTHMTCLAEAMKVNTTLTELDLSFNNTRDAGVASLAEAMKVNTTLTRLSLRKRVIGACLGGLVGQSIKVNTTLRQLDLGKKNVGAGVGAFFTGAMKVTLTQLDLEESNIGDSVATSLAEAMKVNTTLAQLNLLGNNIGAAGAASLAEAMKVNTALTVVYNKK